MKRGFDYWKSDKVLSVLKRYVIICFVFYLGVVSLAMFSRNPFIFFIIGILPYMAIFTYKIVHNPFYNLKDSIGKIDPKLFQLIFDKRAKLNIQIKEVTNQKREAALLYGGLLLLKEEHMDPRVVAYIKNNKRINWLSIASLCIWFFTSLFLLVVF